MPSCMQPLRVSALLLSIVAFLPAMRAADAPDHVPGRLLVSPRRNVAAERVQSTLRMHAAQIGRSMDALNVHVVEASEDPSEATIEALRASGLFEYVERDYYAHTGGAQVIPNDPNYASQWHLLQIQAAQAWAVNTGSVTVAVVDSGVDATHPDLAAKLVPGWNFVNNNSTTADVLGHGTAVAGTLAAISNNGVGVAGVSWGSKIMPLVVVDSTDFASYSNIAAAIQYAADQGVRIINVSIGGSSPSAALQSAVNYALGKGSIVFASAMNNSTSAPYYPAACTGVVSVSATDSTDSLASFSNYGNWITVAAPGQNILTTTVGGGYGYWYGTSFSSPITAGVAALILSVNPALSASAVVSLLEQNTDDLGTAGFDNYFGWGRVNAYKAVLAARQTLVPVTVALTPPTATLSAGQTVQLSATVTGTSSAVTWSLSPVLGTIANGLYTAPASIGSTQTVNVTASVGGVSASATITLNPPPVTTPSFSPIRVNAGGSAYTDSQGRTWSTDTGYINGYTWSVANSFLNTNTIPVYQTCRYGYAFNYLFSVPNGTYTVNLKFAEVSRSGVGQRVFNVGINGAPVLSNFDILAQAGGEFIALDKPFTVTVTGGQINIAFTAGTADWPMVNGIEILSGTAPSTPIISSSATFTPILINAGGATTVDAAGQTWAADNSYLSGYSWGVTNGISGTTSPALYQTCRYGPAFNYVSAVPNGTYTVTLKFAEVSRTAPGQRQFNVSINGSPVLTNFDIFAAAGGEYMVVDKTFTVAVAGGQINIAFTAGSDWAMVNAIQITAVSLTATSAAAAPSAVASSANPIRINAGGSGMTDAAGAAWIADTSYENGYTWAVTNAIAGTATPALYQTCRYGSAFNYVTAVPDGTYTVNLKFAEVSRTAPGQRLFNVAINGAPVLTDFDIFAAAGAEFTAVDKPFTVPVTGGQMNIAFTASTDWAMVNAIEIIPAALD